MIPVHRTTAAPDSAGVSPGHGSSSRRIRDICHARIVGCVSSHVERTRAPEQAAGALQLSRGISATWWYTASAVMFMQVALVAAWTGVTMATDLRMLAPVVVGGGGLLWCASTVPLLIDYRHRVDAGPGVPWSRLSLPLLVAVAYGITAGLLAGSWQLALWPLVQSVALLNWPRGIRLRVVITASVLLVALGIIDSTADVRGADVPEWVAYMYSALLPVAAVSSLWFWDVLVALDRARASEARLAATQERLRVATDVHDLQGHHLQVIALQLELAERLLPVDPDAGLDQLRAARVSVDEARQGTRDLATRFRSVPLGDELANACDLLRAAGLDVEAEIAVDADAAPASDLGPVIRETTTNVLRHGAGGRARLVLAREASAWRYEIANDVAPGDGVGDHGSGLEGIARRIADAGGTLDVRREPGEFAVVVTVPAGASA